MTYLRHLDAETKTKLQAAKKKARQESKAERLARARETLKTTEAKFRKPREIDRPYLAYVRRCPCLVCVIRGEHQILRTDPAHVRRRYDGPGWRAVGGGERPSDFRAIPLCRAHHEEQHDRDNHDWYAENGIHPPTVCARLKAAQVADEETSQVIHEIASDAKQNLL